MTRYTGGDKRSSWITFLRRLCVVRRLIRGAVDPEEIIAAVQAELGEETYPSDARSALRHDLTSLRGDFGCTITFRNGKYWLEHLGKLALLDLPDDELEGLSLLNRMVVESTLSNVEHMTTLLERIKRLLPPERQKSLAAIRQQPQIETPSVVYEPPLAVEMRIKPVINRQQISFAYHSPYHIDSGPVRHWVAPYDLVYRDGHTYLEGYCLACERSELTKQYHPYRLSRIDEKTLEVLPDTLPPIRPERPIYTIQYELTPAVASRQDISMWFTKNTVTFRADGSALVEAETYSLWQARQILLRYGSQCRILEPPELITMMRETIDQMHTLYQEKKS
jgi:predicted DNA-binding transcriptional regulator YafY